MDTVRRPIRHTNEFWDHYGVLAHTPEGGDLIFFSRNGLYPTHVGIMRDEESYIHAPGVSDSTVAVESITKMIIRRRSGAQRQLYFSNPIGYKAPTIPRVNPTYRYHQEVIADAP